MQPEDISFDLPTLPEGTELCGVETTAAVVLGRPALRVALDCRVNAGAYGIDFVDEPTFVLLPVELTDGVIEVDCTAARI